MNSKKLKEIQKNSEAGEQLNSVVINATTFHMYKIIPI